MNKNIEKEYAILLNDEQYQRLSKAYDYQTIKQINYYYASNNKNIGLRIRGVDGKYIFTMKVAQGDESLEFEKELTSLNLNDEAIHDLLVKHNLSTPYLLGRLSTTRKIYRLKYGELALDRCNYLGHTDYELEYELYDHNVDNIDEFIELLSEYNIEFNENLITKYARFINRRKKMKVAIFNANGTEESEAIVTYNLLKRAHVDVDMISINDTKEVLSSHNLKYLCHKTIDEVNMNDYAAMVLPGGMPGTINLQNNKVIDKWIDSFNEEKKLICAICAAPSILISKGLVNDEEFIVFPGFEKGKRPADAYVCQKDNIITAKSLAHAFNFAKLIIANLTSEESAEEVIEEITQSK